MLFRRSRRTTGSGDDPGARATAGDDVATFEEGPEAPDDEREGDIAPESEERSADDSWRARAAVVIPGGASTGSKRPSAMYGESESGEGEGRDADGPDRDDEVSGPTHFVSASGCAITTAGGDTLIDCTMALGAVAIGYGDRLVAHSVGEAALQGNIAGLSHVREVSVAERLCEVIPCAESVLFLKTGAEGVAAAVRIARVQTGREHVIGCGYFGWLDWSSAEPGVPTPVRSTYTKLPFDDVTALDRAVSEAGDRLAAIVLEPVIERLPSTEWIAAARAHCDRVGAVLIFDEIKTGFRLRTGGYQELSGVQPDLSVFGKALANGFPLAAVVGQRDVMDAARRTWISSTLASEGSALAAAAAVLEWHERADVCESLWSIGADLRAGVATAIEASGLPGVAVDGIDPMWLIRFDDPGVERRFLRLALREGVLFKRGAYNFASLSHEDDSILQVERAASTALVELRRETRD